MLGGSPDGVYIYMGYSLLGTVCINKMVVIAQLCWSLLSIRVISARYTYTYLYIYTNISNREEAV